MENTVSDMMKELAFLKSVLLSKSSDTGAEIKPGSGEKEFKFLPRSYSSAVEGDIPPTTSQTAATKLNFLSSDRKFNLMLFGIEESPKGTQDRRNSTKT